MKTKVSLIGLGCDKNRVESEYLLAELGKEYEIVSSGADVTVINTCAFIKSAIEESIDNIFEEASRGAKIIVTGCLPMRYKKEDLLKDFPEVSAFVDTQHYSEICKIVADVVGDKRVRMQNHGLQDPVYMERMLDNITHYAYLRIADGCNNRCSYCAIPQIRGGYRAVPKERIVAEAKSLIERYQTKEFILVAQDVSRYTDGETDLCGLIDLLEEAGVQKIRLMYCYPEAVTEKLIEKICNDDKIIKYLDIPLQHINDDVLKAMNRKSTKASIVELLEKLADKGITVRSTFITGFPGETDEQHRELLSFIQKGLITYAGFFPYYREEGTPAYSFDGQIKKSVKLKRLKELETAQTLVTAQKMQSFVGKTVDVTFDYIDYDKNLFVGHMDSQHPTVDTKVYFKSNDIVEQGQVYRVNVKSVKKLDLIGETL